MAEVSSPGKVATDTMATMPTISGMATARCTGVMAQYTEVTGTKASKADSAAYGFQMVL